MTTKRKINDDNEYKPKQLVSICDKYETFRSRHERSKNSNLYLDEYINTMKELNIKIKSYIDKYQTIRTTLNKTLQQLLRSNLFKEWSNDESQLIDLLLKEKGPNGEEVIPLTVIFNNTSEFLSSIKSWKHDFEDINKKCKDKPKLPVDVIDNFIQKLENIMTGIIKFVEFFPMSITMTKQIENTNHNNVKQLERHEEFLQTHFNKYPEQSETEITFPTSDIDYNLEITYSFKFNSSGNLIISELSDHNYQTLRDQIKNINKYWKTTMNQLKIFDNHKKELPVLFVSKTQPITNHDIDFQLISDQTADGFVFKIFSTKNNINGILKFEKFDPKNIKDEMILHEFVVGLCLKCFPIFTYLVAYTGFFCYINDNPSDVNEFKKSVCTSIHSNSLTTFMIGEYINNLKTYDQITWNDTDCKHYWFLLLLTLDFFARKFEFVHGDLHIQNCAIIDCNIKIEIGSKTINIKKMPKLIDFGRSRVVVEINGEKKLLTPFAFFNKDNTFKWVEGEDNILIKDNINYKLTFFDLCKYAFSCFDHNKPRQIPQFIRDIKIKYQGESVSICEKNKLIEKVRYDNQYYDNINNIYSKVYLDNREFTRTSTLLKYIWENKV